MSIIYYITPLVFLLLSEKPHLQTVPPGGNFKMSIIYYSPPLVFSP